MVLLLPVEEIGIGNRALPKHRSLRINGVEFVWIREWQRIQQNAVHDGKERGVRADPRASVRTAIAANPRLFENTRNAYRMSCQKLVIEYPRGTPSLRDGLLPLDTAAPWSLFPGKLGLGRRFSSRRCVRI